MITRRRNSFQALFLTLMLVITACTPLKAKIASPGEPEPINISGEEWEETGSADVAVEEMYVPAAADPPKSFGSSPKAEEADVAPIVGEEGRHDIPEQQTGMRAGSVDDNEQWDDYLLYRIQFSEWDIPVREIDVTERHIIRVTNGQGLPILGAKISIFNEQGLKMTETMTTSQGRALFFPLTCKDPNSRSFAVEIEKDGQTSNFMMDRDQREHEVILEAGTTSDPVRLDILFLIDATGSMSDEIYQLKQNMILISERIHRLPSNPDVRFGMTAYRDRGDEFISRTLDFTPDIDTFTHELSALEATGGGDYPESLNEGIHDAIHLPEWRIEETVSLIFLIADAPPHLDYTNDFDYAEEVFEAAERGIKIFPLASSGLDDQGEYIFRQLAQITGGKFLFLTYGPDGKPGDSTSHHVDDYSVLSLDELIIRLVEEELGNLGIQQNYTQ
jgi:hypothetical protein